jgi:inner membrane protein
VITLTFFLVFLGVGALITALFTWTGVTPGLNSQLLCFAASSLVTMVLFRGMVKKLFGKSGDNTEYSQLVGQKAHVSTEIPIGHEGKVSYRGSEWIAFSDSPKAIPEGSLVTIVSTDGIKLKVAL